MVLLGQLGSDLVCEDVWFCLQPMAREYQNGDGFGYILGFRKKDTSSWTEVRVPRVESSRHVYYNSSLAAYTPFEVKIKAYNRKGEGPFSQVAVVHSAEEGEYRWRSATSTTVWSLWQMSQCPSELLWPHHCFVQK